MKITQIEVDDCMDCPVREKINASCRIPDGDTQYLILRKKDEQFPSFCPLLKGIVIVTKGE